MSDMPSPEEIKKTRYEAARKALLERPMSLADFVPEEEPAGAFASGSPASPEGRKVYRAMEQGSLTPQGAPSATALMAEEALGGPVVQAAGKALKAAPLVGAAAEGFSSAAGRAKELVKGALKGKAAPTAGAEADAYFAPEALKFARANLDKYKSRETLVYLTPEQFLRMAEPVPSGAAPYKAERVAKALEEGSKFTDIPYLQLGEGGRVKGHEGRHRAMALMERGVQRIPVRIEADNIRWSEQRPNPEGARKAFDYVENLPEEMIGEDGVSRIPFPFHREGPKRGQPLDMYRADASGSDVAPITRRTPKEKPSELVAEPDPLSAEALLDEMILREEIEKLSLSPSVRAEKLVKGALKGNADEVVEEAATAGVKKADEAADAAKQWQEKGVESPYFKRWFGGSKVVDKGGKPVVLYHSGTFDEALHHAPDVGAEGMHFGTKRAAEERIAGKPVDDMIRGAEYTQEVDEAGNLRWWWRTDDGLDSFDIDPRGFDSREEAKQNLEQAAVSFAESNPMDWAEEIPITRAYLSLRNPKRVPDQKGNWTEAVAQAKAEGHDGIIYRNEYEDRGKDSYIAFDPTQIKSATGNVGTFDPKDPRIAYGVGAGALAEQARKDDE